MQLPGRLQRSASLVLAAGLAAALVLAFMRADDDVRAEMRSAMVVAQVVARAQSMAAADDAAAVQALRETFSAAPLRHLRISVRDDEGRLVFSALQQSVDAAPWLEPLVALQRQWRPQADPAPLVVTLPRTGGASWSLLVTPEPDSERRESMLALVQIALVLALAFVTLVLLLRLQIRRALAPMGHLLDAIHQLRRGGGHAEEVQALPPMPVRELQDIADALAELDGDLKRTERERRLLSLRLQSLQEDERRRIAQELHDELGQRLTALRLETAALQRRLHDRPEEARIAAALGAQVQSAQLEVSDLLRRLAPRADHPQPAQRLRELIEELLAPRGAAQQADGQVPAASPRIQADLLLGDRPLSEALMMNLYRMSQEALTNARRHASASRVLLAIKREGPLWHWRCEDDGIGLDDQALQLGRGNGLAGLRERAWAFGGDLQIGRPDGGGLRLMAVLRDGDASPSVSWASGQVNP